ncbi:hypothetical protein [Streptomyces sp. NPDC005549]|uniref:hypothetical protein n=1 Tax=Streptomyces sp. NPDC005549 TaxID=3154888 RepID=UPI0033A31AE8
MVRHIREQLDAQLISAHPGYICANGPEIEHPAIGRSIPHHMIVDPRTGTIEVHFGPWTVETSEFRRYGRDG